MALPTSDNTVNVTRLGSILSTLWGKIKTALGNKANKTDLAPTYSTSSTYAVGDMVIYNNTLYKCITAITTPESWTSAHWTTTDVDSELENVEPLVCTINEEQSGYVCDHTILDIAAAYNAGKPIVMRYIVPGYGIQANLALGEFIDYGEEQTTQVHGYAIGFQVEGHSGVMQFIGRNISENSQIIPDEWTMDEIASNNHQHGRISSDGKAIGYSTDTTRYLRADGEWTGVFGTPTTSNNSNIAWCIKLTRLSKSARGYARVTVDLSRYTDADDFGFVDVCIKTHTTDWHAFAVSHCRRNVAKQFGQCRYISNSFNDVDGVCYIGIQCSSYNTQVLPTLVGSYMNGQFSVELGDFFSEVSGNGSVLQTRFPTYANYNGYDMANIGQSYNPVYINSTGEILRSNVYEGYCDLEVSNMLHFQLPATANYGSIKFFSSVATYPLEYTVAFATSNGVFTLVPSICCTHHYTNTGNAKPSVYYSTSGTDLYFGFPDGSNMKRIRWLAQMDNISSLFCEEIARSSIQDSSISAQCSYDNIRFPVGQFTNWSSSTSTVRGMVAQIKYTTGSGNYINLSGTVIFQQYSTQMSGIWQIRLNTTDASLSCARITGVLIPDGFKLVAFGATYSDTTNWRGQLIIEAEVTGRSYSAVSITVDQAVEGTGRSQGIFVELFSDSTYSYLPTSYTTFVNQNIPCSNSSTVGNRFQWTYLYNGELIASDQYMRTITTTSNVDLTSSTYTGLPNGAMVVITNSRTDTSSISVTYKTNTTGVSVSPNRNHIFTKISNSLWAYDM